jgi:arylsulfatase A-like enzyme
MNLIKSSFYLLVCIALISCSKRETSQETLPEQPNILFISIDDLRPELGSYGNEYVKSPNIDRLSENSTVFTNHYVTVPTCGASRYAMLTGRLPKTKGHLRNNVISQYISEQPETETPETFIHHLKRQGYYTVGIGKISHHPDGLVYGYNDTVSKTYELPHSWDEMLFNPGKWETGWNAFFGYANGENRQSLNKQVKPYESADVSDTSYPDGLSANLAIEKLKELKQNNKPFFLGVGFFKPHLPFTAPKHYWDLYNADDIPLSPNPDLPKNVNTASLHRSGEFNAYKLGEEKASLKAAVSDDYARTLRHAYYASVSYIDAQVGRLLDELKKLELDKNTIVVLWGDHGYHLGDHLVWGKHTIFERALKSPLIIKIPGKTEGSKLDNVVNTVDIYPTLMELSNTHINHSIDGRSLLPIISNPRTDWENASNSYYRNGISLRTERYRLNKYFRKAQPVIELYDHLNDPFETQNIAKKNPEIVKQLMPILEKGNTGLYD